MAGRIGPRSLASMGVRLVFDRPTGAGRRFRADLQGPAAPRHGRCILALRRGEPGAAESEAETMESAVRSSTRDRGSANASRRPGTRPRPAPRQRHGGEGEELAPAEQDLAAYLPLVRQVVHQVQGTLPASVEFDEIMSWGIDGLLDAVRKFDASRGTKFRPYARIRIRGAILDQLRALDWVSRTTRQRANHFAREVQQLEHRLGRRARHDEVAEVLGLTMEELHSLLSEIGDLGLVSLEDMAFGRDNERVTFEDFVAAADGNPLDDLLSQERAAVLSEAIRRLPEKERRVMPLYYESEFTMKEVGALLGITESRVSQLHTQAISRLRTLLEKFAREGLPGV